MGYHVVDPADVEPYDGNAREFRSIGAAVGLENLGVSHVEAAPGGQITLEYHAHEEEEEVFFVWVSCTSKRSRGNSPSSRDSSSPSNPDTLTGRSTPPTPTIRWKWSPSAHRRSMTSPCTISEAAPLL